MRDIRGLINRAAFCLHVYTPHSRSCQILSAHHTSTITVSTINYRNPPLRHYTVGTASEGKLKGVKRRLPRNNEITAESITVVDESGKISGTHRTQEFFEDFDFETKSLVTILEGNPEDGRPPLCRIVEKSVLRQLDINSRKSKVKKKEAPSKIIEMSWVVEKHDLDTKLKRLREFIEKGCKVKFILKAKKKGRLATSDEAKNIIKQILDTVAEAGGIEKSSPEGELLGSMEMSFVPKKSN